MCDTFLGETAIRSEDHISWKEVNISLKKESNYSFRDIWPKNKLYIPFYDVLKSFLPNYLLPCSLMKMILYK